MRGSKKGAHVNAIGAPLPTWRKLEDDAMAQVLVVESRDAVLAESGDVILSGATIYAEVGEIFGGLLIDRAECRTRSPHHSDVNAKQRTICE